MEKQNFYLKASDGKRIFTRIWLPGKELKGSAQIVHGMAEHSGRYNNFSEFLANNGFAVYANDLRGHGITEGDPKKIGFVSEKQGWTKTLKDMHQLTGYIRDKHKGKPVFLLGFSMGSFLARNYIYLWGKDINGSILAGTIGPQGVIGYLGLFLSKIEKAFKGPEAKSPLLHKMSFGNYNSYFKKTRTEFDWLCSNKKILDNYIKDPYCGVICSTSFFHDLIKSVIEINRFGNIKKTPKGLPLLFLTGAKDPLGGMTKGIKKVFNLYKSAGIKDLNYKEYKDSRHEILNDKNKEEAYKDILAWLKSHLKANDF